MTTKSTSRLGYLAAASVLALSVAAPAQTAQARDFGPVAAIKVDPAKAALGKRLFFDPRLSGDAQLSCASCHEPDKGFADGMPLANAYTGSLGFRNTPTLINTALKPSWFHDGRLGTNLNDVTRESIAETYMMNMDMRLMQERLKQDPVYVKMFKAAGYGEPSNGGVRKAIPEYLKTLTSRGAPFDTGKMSADAKAGFRLFTGKAGCAACHTGPLFLDGKPHNLGVPENPEIWSNPLRHITFTVYAKFMGVPNYMNLREDEGALVREHLPDGSGARSFMTPTLRELKYTAPYMHNGTFKTLFEVVSFYNQGGGNDVNKDKEIKPLGLTFDEEKQIVAFLNSLSGKPLTGPEFVSKEIDTDYPAIKNWLNTAN